MSVPLRIVVALAKQGHSKLEEKKKPKTFSPDETQDSQIGLAHQDQPTVTLKHASRFQGLQTRAVPVHVHSAANSVSCLRLCGEPHGEETQRPELLPWQKYCNRNHFTGWGSKSLFSSSHFRSGQSLTHPGHLGVSFPQSQGILGRVPGESRRNRGSLLLQGPRSGCQEAPKGPSSIPLGSMDLQFLGVSHPVISIMRK